MVSEELREIIGCGNCSEHKCDGISCLKNSISSLREDNDRLSNRLSDAQLANDKLREEMHDLREDHAYVTGCDWMAEAHNAQRELAEAQAVIARLEETLRTLEEDARACLE